MNSKLRYYLAIVALVLFTVSCNGSDNSSRDIKTDAINLTPNEAQCAEPFAKNKFIYEVMHNLYYWNNTVPEVDYKNYSDTTALLDDLIYQPTDKYSNILSRSEYERLLLHKNIGLGLNFGIQNNKIYVLNVAVGSAAVNSTLKRGYEVVAINSVLTSSILSSSDIDQAYNDAMGLQEPGVLVTIDYLDYNGTPGSVTLMKTEFTIEDVWNTQVFKDTATGRKIGYFYYKSFGLIDNKLKEAVAYFKNENISDIVIDLRENTGGQLTTAIYLTNILLGKEHLGRPITKMRYNKSYPTVIYRSEDLPNSLNLDKIVFIVSNQTASASELLINALRPYKNVFAIGTDTYGKPVGGSILPFCGDYLIPIMFEVLNGVDEGGYFDGMPVDCYSRESFTNLLELGNPEEQQLKAALQYIKTGTCDSLSRASVFQMPKEDLGYIELLKQKTYY
jgi:carboxyl-terminal processing protease